MKLKFFLLHCIHAAYRRIQMTEMQKSLNKTSMPGGQHGSGSICPAVGGIFEEKLSPLIYSIDRETLYIHHPFTRSLQLSHDPYMNPLAPSLIPQIAISLFTAKSSADRSTVEHFNSVVL